MQPAPIGDPGGWITAKDYPPDAKRSNRQGRVVVALDIGPTGLVAGCRVETTSGTESLDTKTCEVLLERGRFNPATDKRGRPIAGRITLPIRWELIDDGDTPGTIKLDLADAGADIETEVSIGADGKVISCRMITQVMPAAAGSADQCATLKPGTKWGIYTRDGTPTAVVVRQHFTRSVKIAAPTP